MGDTEDRKQQLLINQANMAFTEEELNKWEPIIKSYIENNRPPEELRSQVDIAYAIDDQSFIIYTLRPQWNRPEEKMKIPAARVSWVRSQKVWKVYWQRSDMKWHSYDPLPEADRLETFTEELKADPNACFWG